MVECDKFSRENLQELELTQTMKDFVQLSDLGDGSEVKEIMSHMEEEAWWKKRRNEDLMLAQISVKMFKIQVMVVINWKEKRAMIKQEW